MQLAHATVRIQLDQSLMIKTREIQILRSEIFIFLKNHNYINI
jgi:hypothetical protein